jgi:hypothetical protein
MEKRLSRPTHFGCLSLLRDLTQTILVAAVLAAHADAQATFWAYQPSPTTPLNRANHALASDAAREQVILFGGANTVVYGDTWAWDGISWTALTPSVAPSPRHLHAMAYDTARQRVVLFGGSGSLSATSTFGDTWEWDGTQWQSVGPTSGPAARAGHAMCYDSHRQRVVMFGGRSNSGSLLADTWEWDGANWAPRLSAYFPSGRAGHAMAYDQARQRCVLLGGFEGAGDAETWTWNGTDWQPMPSTTAPPRRVEHTMAFDARSQRVLAFGGKNLGTFFGDTWSWDGVNWTVLPMSFSPAARRGAATTYDEVRGGVVLFGGAGLYLQLGTFFSDTWFHGGSPAVAAPYGSGCGSPPLRLERDLTARPRIGQVARAHIPNAPTPVTAIAMGLSRTTVGAFTLPLPLTGLGMTGCFMLQSADALGLGTAPAVGGWLQFELAIPATPSSIGRQVYLQAYGYAPGENPLEIVVSNGLTWKLGDL